MKFSSASSFLGSCAKGREKARKGARGCVRPRTAGLKIGLKKFFLRGCFAGLKSK